MIRIDRLSFEFQMNHEEFAHNLYASWDEFCRVCIEQVVDDCLFGYDKDKVLYELERLDLDLGNILEEDFYKEFPRRLKKELMKVLPLWDMQIQERQEKTEASRMENLLFYLEWGYPKVEWANEGFSLTEELDWIVTRPTTVIRKLLMLCLNKEYVLHRLLWQVDESVALLRLYATLLQETVFSLYEKRRFLILMLELKPEIPVRFVHMAEEDVQLKDMAELLDTVSVRRIMETEAGEHAEVDLPPYWHYLYEWLVRYYPFNGLAIFGGKSDFVRHLHHRLLTFIRKRNYSFHLSKTELTIGFLLEVFGPTYYIEVLNAIYDLQPHHPDGSPIYDSYFNQELYRIFLQLSLLRLPIVCLTSVEELTAFLKDSQHSSADKLMQLRLLVAEKREILLEWLQREVTKEGIAVSDLVSVAAEIIDEAIISHLLASVSFRAMEVGLLVKDYLRSHISKISWLNGITESQLNVVFRKAILLWIGGGHSVLPEPESFRQLLRLIYREITDSDKKDVEIECLLTELYLSEKDWKQLSKKEASFLSTAYLKKLKTTLTDKNVSDPIKRRMIALFLEKYKEGYAEGILYLHEQVLQEEVFRLISQPALEEIIRQSVVRIDGTYRVMEILPLLYWLVEHESDFSACLRDMTPGLKVQLLVWLAKATRSQMDATRTVTKMVTSLLTALFGKENIPSVIRQISCELVKEMKTGEAEPAEMQTVLNLLLESSWFFDKGFIDWLEDTAVSEDNKRELLQKLVVEKTQEWIRLLRKQSRESKAIVLSAAYFSETLLLQGMARTDFYQASILLQRVEWLQRKAANLSFLSGNNIHLSAALTQALLLYMQDEDTLSGRTLTESETVCKFLSYLHFVYTGKLDYWEDPEWVTLSDRMAIEHETDGWQAITEKDVIDVGLNKDKETDILFLPMERIADTTFQEIYRKALLRSYLYFQPKELLDYIRQSIERNVLTLNMWLEWLDISDWVRIATNLSLSRSELLQQIMTWLSDNNQIKETELLTALATCLINNHVEEWIYNSREEMVCSFIYSLPSLQEKTQTEQETLVQNTITQFNILNMENESLVEGQAEFSEVFIISNAGLCLFSPWLPRLFNILGYLDKDQKSFKDTASKIRAVFLLQYFVNSDEKEYRETELTFNRLLVSLPMHIPLPECLILTEMEKDTADSLMTSVKANWRELQNTSVRGFQQSFIARMGHMEQQEEKWLLIVDQKAFDILLRHVPWGFKQIRFPWLKKYIQVNWYE